MYTDDFFDLYVEYKSSKTKIKSTRYGHASRRQIETGFTCVHCHGYVSTANFISGVQNRNHCPYCLWSRHMDLRQAGDRLCACKARMMPVGLTLKKNNKKYGLAQYGELMLIHLCEECGNISINRIAADDDSQRIMEIFHNGQNLDQAVLQRLNQDGIKPLRPADQAILSARLFGVQ